MAFHSLLQKPVWVLLIFVLLVQGCAGTSTPGASLVQGKDIAVSNLARISNPGVPQSDQDALSAGNRAFSADLYQKLRSQSGNLFFSPYSISLALAMTYAGAQGDTASQMASTLHFTLPPDKLHPAFNGLDQYLENLGQASSNQQPTTPASSGQGFQLNVANSIWGQKGFSFLPAYLDLLSQNYGAGLRLVDFSTAPEPARKTINDWVSQQTKDKIQNLFPQGTIDNNTRLVLANAIYFKASWFSPFEESSTQNGPFNLLDGTQVTVPLMVSGHTASSYEKGDGFQAVGLPYLGENVEMVVVLPDQGRFNTFEAGLDAVKVDQIFKDLNGAEVDLTMPKFKIESSFSLSDTLASMGMTDAFNPSSADFSGMDGKKDLSISQVIHKSYVMVDEKGTEAAAATGVAMTTSAVFNPPVVKVDRPFIFFIYDQKSGTILFVGREMNPAQ
ncbi:MAG TPA: serpin family protein [Anaerolineaceae bacterium]|nr:serpin family protein [Anaerolineaceae bacterium]